MVSKRSFNTDLHAHVLVWLVVLGISLVATACGSPPRRPTPRPALPTATQAVAQPTATETLPQIDVGIIHA